MWLSVILQIVAALPSLIRAVKEILDLINNMPKTMQSDAADELQAILKLPKGNNRLQRLADFKARVKAQQVSGGGRADGARTLKP